MPLPIPAPRLVPGPITENGSLIIGSTTECGAVTKAVIPQHQGAARPSAVAPGGGKTTQGCERDLAAWTHMEEGAPVDLPANSSCAQQPAIAGFEQPGSRFTSIHWAKAPHNFEVDAIRGALKMARPLERPCPLPYRR